MGHTGYHNNKFYTMKKISITCFTCLLMMVLMSGTCSKSDAVNPPAPGPDVLVLNEGFLSTKTGYPIPNLGDTAIIRVSTSSYQVVDTYLAGTLEDKVHYWKLENAGGNMRYIRSVKHGTYLGYRTEPTATAGYYPWATTWITLDKLPGDRNRFLITKKDKNFYIQPADDQTLYLNTTTTSQISYTGPVKADELHFLPKKQEFFFLKPF
jgi:hypothetical protein